MHPVLHLSAHGIIDRLLSCLVAKIPNQVQPLKIVVISLATATARRSQVGTRLNELGCEFEFFDALNGAAGTGSFHSIDTRKHVLNTGRLPTQGEVGCYASHLGVWQDCVDSNEPVCVLEDDCYLEDFFPAALATASRLCGQYGFIRLQTESRGKKRLLREADDFQLCRYTKMPHSTLAYVIAPGVAKSFIARSTVMDCPVDVFIKRFWEHGNALYGLTPYSARESSLANDTSIRSRKRLGKDPITRIARVVTKADWYLRRTAFNRTFGKR